MNSLGESLVRVTYTREEDLPVLKEMAKADNHAIIAPTHTIWKGSRIVGYLSIGVLPTVLVWMDTQLTKSRDSMMVVNFFENACRDRHATGLALPCHDSSPYKPFLEPLGYVYSGAKLYLKGL